MYTLQDSSVNIKTKILKEAMACKVSSRCSVNWSRCSAKTTGVVIIVVTSSVIVPVVIVVTAVIIRATVVIVSATAGVVLDGHRTSGSCSVVISVVLVIISAERGRSVLVRGRVVLIVLVVLVLIVVLIGVDGGAFVSDVRVEACLPVGVVGYNLGSAVRKLHSVFASDLVTVAGFFAFVVVAAVVVFYLVAEFVSFGL